jgi:hypothetical protein
MNELNKYSDFNTVNANAKRLYEKVVFLSTRKNKKYMIMNDDNNWIHFGQLGYIDFSKSRDQEKKNNYLKRATKIKGDWKTNI